MAFPWKNKKLQISEVRNPISKKEKNFLVKAIGLLTSQGSRRGDFEDPEYSLDEIKIAADADSYIKMALMKYSYLIYKAGYTLKSENDKATEYIKTRFKIMGYSTGTPIDILFEGVSDDLVKYSNSFLLKSRVEAIGYGVRAKGIDKNNRPIGGYFRADPAFMRIKRDGHGTVTAYEQYNDSGERKTFAPTEVIHFYIDKEAGSAYGTPRIIAAMEDVKLLRRIEGNVISLIYRFAIPLYHFKIGIPQPGLQAGDAEIDEAKREVENMAMEGSIFTNERTSINAIGAEGTALDATGYLAYFEKRVFAALGVSEAQMGRSGTSQKPDSVEGQIHDVVKHIQRSLRIFIENMIIHELLIEGGFNPLTNDKDIVAYEFNEISLDTKVKLENHEMLKFQSNVHTFGETRTSLGLSNEVNQGELYSNMITGKLAIDQQDNVAKNNKELAILNSELSNDGTAAKSNSSGKSGNNGIVTAKANDDVKTRNMPANKNGTYSVKINESFDDSEKQEKKIYSDAYNTYYKLRNDILEAPYMANQILEASFKDLSSCLRKIKTAANLKGEEKAVNELEPDINLTQALKTERNSTATTYDTEYDEMLTVIIDELSKRISDAGNTDKASISSIFSAVEHRLTFLIKYIKEKAFWSSYLMKGEELGKTKACITVNEKKKEIDIKTFVNSDILEFGSLGSFNISFEEDRKSCQ